MTQALTTTKPWLKGLITEVCIDAATAEMKKDYSPLAIERVATLFREAVYNFVVSKGKNTTKEFEVPMQDFVAFTLMCRILERIEQTIPVAGNIQVTCNHVSKEQYQAWVEGFRDAAGQAKRK